MTTKFNVEYIAGGAALNSIRVAQWMLQTEGSTAYIGCIGQDAFGSQLCKSANKDGVSIHLLKDKQTPTG